MRESELDSVLQVIENPIRRRIIKRLSQEPGYALQLSKELGLGQPLVAKHLSIMERAGLVTSALESSPNGPERRRYSLAMSISITMDVAPHLFKERAISFNASPMRKALHAGKESLDKQVQEAVSAPDERQKLLLISKVLDDIDSKVHAAEEERVGLLSVRNELMNEAAKIVVSLGDLNTRRVIFHILEEHDREVGSISQSLDMREIVVRSILDDLERDIFG